MTAIGNLFCERQAVWFDRRRKRGVILEFVGDEWAKILTSGGTVGFARVDSLEPLPITICFRCGVRACPPEDEPKILEGSVEAFGAAPPPERRTVLCEACLKVFLAYDASLPFCICAASTGKATRCVCAARRQLTRERQGN